MPKQKKKRSKEDELRDPTILTLGEIIRSDLSASEKLHAIRQRIDCKPDPEDDTSDISRSRPEHMIWSLDYVIGDILNGGFHQMLLNSTGDRAELAQSCLKEIEAISAHQVFLAVAKELGWTTFPKDQDTRQAALDAWESGHPGEDFCRNQDRQFYDLVDDVERRMIAYVKKNRTSFAEPEDDIVRKYPTSGALSGYYKRQRLKQRVAQADVTLDDLLEAAALNDTNLFHRLLPRVADLSVRDSLGQCAIHRCVRLGVLEYIKALVEAGADVNAKCLKGWTPLFYLRKYCGKTEENHVIYQYLKSVGGAEIPSLQADEPL